jgi:DNA repair exonuclease SbcCD ATPase subunit
MEFTIGNIITLLVVVIILAIYRQLDKNNRSLEKIKRYSEKIKDELDAYVDGKTVEVKNFAIELDVHQETGKAILNRISKAEDHLESRAAYIEKMYERINEYDKALDELTQMTLRVQDNLDRLHEESEFVDKVGKRVKEAGLSIIKLEKEIPGLKVEFAKENIKELKVVRAVVLKDTQKIISRIRDEITTGETRINNFTTMVKALENTKESMEKETTLSIQKFLDEQVYRTEQSGEQLTAELSDRFDTILARKTEEAESIEAGMQESFEKISKHLSSTAGEMDQRIDQFRAQVKTVESDYTKSLSSIQNNLDEKMLNMEKSGEQLTAELSDRFGNILTRKLEEVESIEAGMRDSFDNISEHFASTAGEADQKIIQFKAQVKTVEGAYLESLEAAVDRGKALEDEVFDSLKEKISLDRDTLKKEFDASLVIINNSVSSKLSEFGSSYSEITDKTRKELEQISTELHDSDSAVRDRITSVESRVHEYEDSINYKFTRLEDIGSDLDSLEKNLRISMEQTTSGIEADFLNYETQQDKTQQEYQEKISGEMKELYDGLNNLDVELNGLKNRAYENVAKGLKIFEDDFFSDLKNKNAAMEEKIIEWQGSIDKNLEELARTGDEKRFEIEKEYSENLREKLEDVQERVFSNQSKFESQVSDFQTRVEERMSQSSSSMITTEESIKKELLDIQESAKASFSREFVEFNTGISAQLKKSDREIESRLKSIEEIVEQKMKELLGFTENAQSEVTVWQVKILQELKEAQNEMTVGYEDLKKNVFNNISQIKVDFESQKEDLIIGTQEERARIKNELKENASGIVMLQADLRNKTETAMENFNREYETFILEIQKKNRDMQVEFDKRIKDFRLITSENRGKTEQLQKKLYGKIEENYKILAVNLQEIDKRQKGFINQTKIFDRADSLKISLQESIEDLKSELVKVEAQSNEAREIKRKFSSIYKLGDEVNVKLGRFLSEKRRIEEMEGDFKKLIIISQSVDTKLRQVTGSHDDLQAIQIKIRNLEELEKEVSIKYERLEKKDQIIENTTVSVDKNFQQLSELDDRVRSLRDDVTRIPESIHDISSKIELLSRNKKKADETAKQVAELDGILKDIEERIKNMQKAREWLAKTETRMEEVSKQAQEQVKLLGSILKEGNKSGSGSKGAPSMGARDVVTRLAHQGWSIQEIASTTKLSRGEVELILELLPKK